MEDTNIGCPKSGGEMQVVSGRLIAGLRRYLVALGLHVPNLSDRSQCIAALSKCNLSPQSQRVTVAGSAGGGCAEKEFYATVAQNATLEAALRATAAASMRRRSPCLARARGGGGGGGFG